MSILMMIQSDPFKDYTRELMKSPHIFKREKRSRTAGRVHYVSTVGTAAFYHSTEVTTLDRNS